MIRESLITRAVKAEKWETEAEQKEYYSLLAEMYPEERRVLALRLSNEVETAEEVGTEEEWHELKVINKFK